MSFLKDKPFIFHIALASAFTIMALWFILKMIASYANHNDIIVVPDMTKISTEELDNYFEENKLDLKYEIIDSVYKENFPKGAVVEQDPIAGTNVKPERIIYLTITSKSTEITKMPNLIDLSLKQAMSILESNGLKLGRLEYIPDIAENAVLKQKFKGREIGEGTSIEKGSTINLVLGRGISNEKVEVPNLIGKTRKEAQELLHSQSLNIGNENYEKGIDTTKAVVNKQSPPASSENTINKGNSIDLWYSKRK